MLIAARTASRPASTTSHQLPGVAGVRDGAAPGVAGVRDGAAPGVAGVRDGAAPGVSVPDGAAEDAIRSAARSTARSVARRIDSAAWPVSGATESASDFRSGRAGSPAAVIAAAAG